MDFSTIEGFEEFFSDGVLDPSLGNPQYRDCAKKYKEIAHRVFLLYEPSPHSVGGKDESDGKATVSAAEFDIVFIHGIGSDEFKCWTNEKGILWPAVFLPQDFPSARVLSLGYAHALWNWKGSHKEVAKETPDPSTSLEEKPLPVALPMKTQRQPTREESIHAITKEGADKRPEPSVGQVSSSLDAVWNHLPRLDVPWKSLWGKEDEAKTPDLRKASVLPNAGAGVAPTSHEHQRVSGAAAVTGSSSRSTLYDLLIRDTETKADMNLGTQSANGVPTKGEVDKEGGRQLWSFGLVAADIADRLVSAGVGTGDRPVIFIAHSMGGLITKQMVVSLFQLISLVPRRTYVNAAGERCQIQSNLTTANPSTPGTDAETEERRLLALAEADVFLHSLRGVVFYGTPHFGSGLASVITGLQRYYSNLGGLTPTHVVTGLGDHNRGALTMLNDRFMEVVARLDEQGGMDSAGFQDHVAVPSPTCPMLAAPSAGVSIMSFGETKKLNGLLRVVEPESANPAPDNPRFPFYLLDGDHSQINRPATKTSPGYAMLYGYLDRLQQRGLLQRSERSSVLVMSHTPTAREIEGEGYIGASANEKKTHRDTNIEMRQRFEAEAWESLRRAASSEKDISNSVGSGSQSSGRCTEVDIAMRSLDKSQAALRAALSRFFGRVVPPQLDGIFLLSADVSEFLSQGSLLLQRGEVMGVGKKTPGSAHRVSRIQEDFTTAFLIPARLLLHWTHRAIHLIDSFEQSQRETVVTQIAVEAGQWVGSTSLGSKGSWPHVPGGGGGAPSTVSHLSTRSVRQMDQFEREVGILQGEWEGFRRFLSVAMRRGALPLQHLGVSEVNVPDDVTGVADHMADTQRAGRTIRAVSNERVAVVFFARAVRTLITHGLRDGECLSDLVGNFINSSLEAAATTARHVEVGATERRKSRTASATAQLINKPLSDIVAREAQPLERRPSFVERDAFATLLLESLDLYGSSESKGSPVGSDAGAVLPDRGDFLAKEGVSLDAHLREATPSLRATSSFLLACFHLFLGGEPESSGTARQLFEHTQASLSECRRSFTRLEQQERGQQRHRGGRRTDKKDAPFWWSGNGDNEAKSDGTEGVDQPDNVWRKTKILTESFHLLTCALVCHSYLMDLEAKVPTSSHFDEEDVRHIKERLMSRVAEARQAYSLVEQVLEGKRDDLNKPFIAATPSSASVEQVSLGSDSSNTQRATRPDAGSHIDSSEKAKRAFRDALAGVLKELDGVMNRDAKENEAGTTRHKKVPHETPSQQREQSRTYRRNSNGEEEEAGPWYAPGTNWFSRQTNSLPKLVINSLLNAWEAVRHGGEVPRTPQYYAFNTFVFWWSVETYAECITESIETFGTSHANTGMPDRKAPYSYRAVVERLGRGCEQIPVRAAPQGQASACRGVSIARQRERKEARQRQAKYYSNATPKLRSRWVTASGFVEAAGTHQKLLDALREEVQHVLAEGNHEKEDGTEAAQRVATVLQAVQTPRELGDALQLDSGSPLIRCLVGHWHFFNLRGSPDAAHAYAQVMKTERDPLSPLFQASAVGLGWVHLHRLSATLTTRRTGDYRARTETWEALAMKQGLKVDRLGDRWSGGMANPLGPSPERGGILDPLALWTSPEGLADFGVGAKGLLAFSSALCPASGQAGLDEDASVLSAPYEAPPAVAERLALAEMYFRRVLSANPSDVGALCGLARIRSLVPDISQGRGGFTTAGLSSAEGIPSPRMFTELFAARALDKESMKLHEVAAYLKAAARASEPLLQQGPPTASSMTTPIFGSYAAYWMGCMAHSQCTSAAFPLQTSATHSTRVSQEQTLPLMNARRWYNRAVELDPRNDWALTSLGFTYLEGRLATGGNSDGGKHEADAFRGLSLLEIALKMNPTNQWALWGVGTRSPSSCRRDECFRLLRGLLTQRHRVGVRF